MVDKLPDLSGVATADLVEHIGAGKFSAAYINWSRTMALLRKHAPGWMPELVTAPDGYLLHQAPVGAYLLIRFRHGEDVTPAVPQAVMDARNGAIPVDKITARDITDTHRRGVCLAAAFTFGLAYELWAKLPLETGYQRDGQAGDEDATSHDVQEIRAADASGTMDAGVVGDLLAAIRDADTLDDLRARARDAQHEAQLARDKTAYDRFRAAALARSKALKEASE